MLSLPVEITRGIGITILFLSVTLDLAAPGTILGLYPGSKSVALCIYLFSPRFIGIFTLCFRSVNDHCSASLCHCR